MQWSTSVLTQHSSDTEPTVVVNFDNAKYVFNVGENTSRSYVQSTQRFNKVRGIFISEIGTQRTAGLAGYLMTLADMGRNSKVDIVGPEGLKHLLCSMRTYLYRDNIAVIPKEVPSIVTTSTDEPIPAFKDQNITVFSIPVLPDTPIATPTNGLKRKRSTSPPKSPKRISTGEPSARALTTSSHRAASQEPYVRPPSPALRSSRGKAPAPENPYAAAERSTRTRSPPRVVPQEDMNALYQSLVSWMFSKPAEPVPSDLDYIPVKTPRAPKQKKAKGVDDTAVQQQPSAPPAKADTGTDTEAVPLRPSIPPRPLGFYDRLPAFTAYRDPLTHRVSPLRRPAHSWVVVGPVVRGKFDAKRAEALGLPQGPLRGKLIAGQEVKVMVDDGNGGKVERIIKPEECVGPTDPSKVVIILDVPTVNHIIPLVASFGSGSYFERFRLDEHEERHVHVVYHLLGEGVLDDPRYKDFMNSFPSDVQHVVSSPQHTADRLTFTSAGFNQLRLNQLDATIFPLPKFTTVPKVDLSELNGYPSTMTQIYPDMHISVRPPGSPASPSRVASLDNFHPALANPSLISESLPEATRALYTQLKEEVASVPKPESAPGDDVRIIPLGTSSAVPSKYRNVSSTIILTPEHGNILLDAGEGTWGQLARFFGTSINEPENVWEVLRNLKCIFISHMHGDHHIGLMKILAMREKLHPHLSEPLYIVAPSNTIKYLIEFGDLEEFGLHPSAPGGVRVINSELVHGPPYVRPPRVNPPAWNDETSSRKHLADMCVASGITHFQTVEANHGCRCLGCVLRHKDGWSLAYSGDTRPTQALIEAGKDATVLIHEATMNDEDIGLAKVKKHSTIGEAIGVGARMNAKHILLTHFSARIPQGRPSSTEVHNGTISYAIDHAHLRVGDMWKMAHYLPAVKQTLDAVDDAEGEAEEEEARVRAMGMVNL